MEDIESANLPSVHDPVRRCAVLQKTVPPTEDAEGLQVTRTVNNRFPLSGGHPFMPVVNDRRFESAASFPLSNRKKDPKRRLWREDPIPDHYNVTVMI